MINKEMRSNFEALNLDGANLHQLVVGVSGSGKSTYIRNMLDHIEGIPNAKVVLIDPKRVELLKYRRSLKTLWYAASEDEIYDVLCRSECLMDTRLDRMVELEQFVSDEDHVFIIVDEMAYLMQSSHRKEYVRMFSDIAIKGRSAKVHLVLCTQVATQDVIPACIRDNMTNIVAFRQRDDGKYRYLLGCAPGRLPQYGYAYVFTPSMYNRPEKTKMEDVWQRIVTGTNA